MSSKCWGNFQPSVQQFDSVGYTGLPAVHTRYRLKFDRACKPLEIERFKIERSKGQSRVYRPLPADCYDTHSTGYSWGRAVKTEEHTEKKEPIGKARNAAVQCLILRTFGKDIERDARSARTMMNREQF